ncbi:MAG: acyl--CoA ligase [Ktedonobacteraceae bacterium]|nr:acyl--CoA ligase [Ktedonobacteraceae bacterium]
MSLCIMRPELFRTSLDIPEVPYDYLLRQAAERVPERPAIVYHDFILTYREVISIVNSLANGLRALGIGKGDCICIFTANRPEFSILLQACATIGAILSPINPVYKQRELAYQLGDTEAKVIVVQRELLSLLQAVLREGTFPHLQHILLIGGDIPDDLPQAISFARLIHESSPKQPEPAQISSDDVLVLPYSSGTTGLPKGVMLTHRNLVANHTQFRAAARISHTDVTVIFLPLYHIYGILLTGSFLAAGATQVLMERFDMDQALDICERYGVTWFFAVPPILLTLNATPPALLQQKMQTVRYIKSAAAPLAPALAQSLQAKLGIAVVQGYGLTESSPCTHFSPLELSLARPGSVGLPVHNTEQKVVDLETGNQELPPGQEGEILVRGPQVMLGYWKAPEENIRALRDGWLYTGDIGYVDEDGYLYIVDRKKEMIKYKGFSIAPAELEAVLLTHRAVQDAAVIGVADEQAGEVPKGFVVLRPGQQASAEELMAFVNENVAGYKKLHSIEFINTLPRNPSGKILRRTLKEREKSAIQNRASRSFRRQET